MEVNERLKAEKDQAVKDIESILNTVEAIRRSNLIIDGDIDDALGCICEKYCSNYGKNCFVHGDEPFSCKNFDWRGLIPKNDAENAYKLIRVIIKEPGKTAEETQIENTLEGLQSVVGGYIETVTIASDLVVICDEEGRIKNKPYNCDICGVSFVGTIVLCGIDGDDFADIPKPLEKLKRSVSI